MAFQVDLTGPERVHSSTLADLSIPIRRVEPAFGLPKLTQHLALRDATSAKIGLRHPIFGYLSNIAQRQHARKEILAWRASG